MKVVHFCTAPVNTSGSNTYAIINRYRELGHEVIFYDFWKDEREKNKVTTRHFQMYEGVLNFAEEQKADLLLMEDNLAVPEYLLSELKIRPKYKPKIAFFMLFREGYKSLARATVVKELINMPQIHKALVVSMFTNDVILPENYKDINMDKVALTNEPFAEPLESYSKSKVEARTIWDLPQDKFIALYSGRLCYIKGVDILMEASQYIDKDVFLVIQYFPGGMDLSENILGNLIKYRGDNFAVIKKWVPFGGEISSLFNAIDVNILPHRRLCEYSQSSGFQAAYCARKPVIAPDFYYFNEIIRRHKAGIVYEPENPQALGEAVNIVYHNYETIMENARFDEALKDYIPKSHWADKALEGW